MTVTFGWCSISEYHARSEAQGLLRFRYEEPRKQHLMYTIVYSCRCWPTYSFHFRTLSADETATAVSISAVKVMSLSEWALTIHTRIVRLNVAFLDLSVFDNESISLTSIVAEDGGAVEREVHRSGKLGIRVAEEANLHGC